GPQFELGLVALAVIGVAELFDQAGVSGVIGLGGGGLGADGPAQPEADKGGERNRPVHARTSASCTHRVRHDQSNIHSRRRVWQETEWVRSVSAVRKGRTTRAVAWPAARGGLK